MSIKVTPVECAIDATALVTVTGPPNRAVYWSLSNTAGTITPINLRTDDLGRAAAIFAPDVSDLGNLATITVEYGS